MPMIQPAIEDGFAAVPIRQGAGEEVGSRFDNSECCDEGEGGGELGEPELFLSEQRQDGSFLADHAADQCVDTYEQRELGNVLAQPEANRRRCGVGRCAHRPTTSGWPLDSAHVSGPPSRTVTSRWPRRVRMLAPVMARSPCPHITVTGPAGTVLSARLPSSMLIAPATWPARYSVCWRTSINVDHGLGWSDEWDAGDRSTCCAPGVDAAVELADDVVVSDVECLADDLVTVLVGAGDDHDRPVEVGDPAEPAGEHRSQRVGDRTGDVAGRELCDRSGIDDQRPGDNVEVDGVDIEPFKLRQVRIPARAAPVQLGQSGEIARERPEPGEELFDEGVFVVDSEQGIGGALASQRGRAVGAAWCRAERAAPVRWVDGQFVREPVESSQRVKHLVRQGLCEIRAAQVGTADRADHQANRR